MCPICIATAAWLATGATATGGVAAVTISKLRAASGGREAPPPPRSKENRS